jgi:tRNA (adenine57-N1/adenine58-N1)-methyltransferase catalytic subunit
MIRKQFFSLEGFLSVQLFVYYCMKIQEGYYVLLFHSKRKKWLVKVTAQKKMHTHLGVIDVSSVIGLEYGSLIKTTEGKSVYLIQPTVYDFIMKSERKTQIVYPKDLGYIASRTGLQNGSKVLEIGTGSAALTTFMASIVRPTGHIYTYDVNADFMAIARKNLEKAEMLQYVTMHQQDPHLGLSIREADVAVVDLGDPWSVVAHVHVSLKGSGAFVAICPTMNQLEKTATVLKQSGYVDVDCVEIMIRDIEAREGMTRPSMRMIGHTTYLIFGRKVESSSFQLLQNISSS